MFSYAVRRGNEYRSYRPQETFELPSTEAPRLKQSTFYIFAKVTQSVHAMTDMELPSLNTIAVPTVLCLISFLAFSSQYLFLYIDPRPLNSKEYLTFNLLISCLLICYFRAIRTDPGRVPPVRDSEESASTAINGVVKPRQRWCRKCDAYKPPRAHHCKICGR